MNVCLVHLDDSVARLESDLLNGASPATANIYPVLTASVSLLAMASTGPFAGSSSVCSSDTGHIFIRSFFAGEIWDATLAIQIFQSIVPSKIASSCFNSTIEETTLK